MEEHKVLKTFVRPDCEIEIDFREISCECGMDSTGSE
jgi:hypothetical protein